MSWIAPIAKALMKAEVGDTVSIRTPGGADEIEVVAIAYDERLDGTSKKSDSSI